MLTLGDDGQFGIRTIDTEHQHLINFLHLVEETAPENRPRLATKRLVSSMRGFLLTHFNNEENLMSAIDYSGIDRHMSVHSCMLSTLDIMACDLEVSGESSMIIEFLTEWTVSHYGADDRELAWFVKDVRQRALGRRQQQPQQPGTGAHVWT